MSQKVVYSDLRKSKVDLQITIRRSLNQTLQYTIKGMCNWIICLELLSLILNILINFQKSGQLVLPLVLQLVYDALFEYV